MFSVSARKSSLATQEVASCMTQVETDTLEATKKAGLTRDQGTRLNSISHEFKATLSEFRICHNLSLDCCYTSSNHCGIDRSNFV